MRDPSAAVLDVLWAEPARCPGRSGSEPPASPSSNSERDERTPTMMRGHECFPLVHSISLSGLFNPPSRPYSVERGRQLHYVGRTAGPLKNRVRMCRR